ncbi:hypothetical protein ABFG93_04320 [Pseudalkalibacillus hwajinpoensis]|uniref:hypothetical protein n=1 Tax=Guptibacillus hwajinpoensis TaxID=208199 RepID=UPI00325B9A23
MPQILFKVQTVKRLDSGIPNTFEAEVEVDIIDRNSGNLIQQGMVPVRFNEHGAFPSISHIRRFDGDKKLHTKFLFDSRRYIRKLRPYPQPDDD